MSESNSKMNKKSYMFAFAAVMAIFSMGQIAGSIDAAIAMIGEEFGLSQATTMYVSSISAIASVIFGLVVGMIAGKKVRYKTVALFSGVCVLAGGLIPFFVTNYGVLLVFRAIYGIGFGGMMSLQNTFANLTLPKEKQACRHFLYQSERMKDYEEKSIMYGIGSDHAADNNGLGNCKTLVAQ